MVSTRRLHARFRLGSTKKPIAIGNRKCYTTRNSGDCTSTLNGRTRYDYGRSKVHKWRGGQTLVGRWGVLQKV